MDTFYRTYFYLIEHVGSPVRRLLMDEIDWNSRLIGIKGSRGIGKTTFLLQFARERFGLDDRSCLYVNMNNFYFADHTITDFARKFYVGGGRTLLVDQVFKYSGWSKDLRECYELFPELRIVFTNSSVMQIEDYPELEGICDLYHLRGFSFREFLNIETGHSFHTYSLRDILANHRAIAETVLRNVDPMKFFEDYLHHGFYPFYLEKRNFSENLVKTMNMMIEVDILLIKQIELKYLSKIKKLLYLIAVDGTVAPNVSQLAKEIDTSRATVMNYIKYLAEARLINMIYPEGKCFPKKPSKLLMHNSNLMYAVYPLMFEEKDVSHTFFINALFKGHEVYVDARSQGIVVDSGLHFRISEFPDSAAGEHDVCHVVRHLQKGDERHIPLWLFGFLY